MVEVKTSWKEAESTWEIEFRERKAKEAESWKQFGVQLSAVAAALGKGWAMECRDVDGVAVPCYLALTPAPLVDGTPGIRFALHVSRASHKPGTIHVSGDYPRMPDGSYCPDHISRDAAPDPSCNISASKSPAQIAADITRRTLPGYTARHEACIRAIRRFIQNTETKAALAARVAKSLGVAALNADRGGDFSISTSMFGCGYGDIKVGTDVRFELRGVSEEIALEICKVLAKHKGEASE